MNNKKEIKGNCHFSGFSWKPRKRFKSIGCTENAFQGRIMILWQVTELLLWTNKEINKLPKSVTLSAVVRLSIALSVIKAKKTKEINFCTSDSGSLKITWFHKVR